MAQELFSSDLSPRPAFTDQPFDGNGGSLEAYSSDDVQPATEKPPRLPFSQHRIIMFQYLIGRTSIPLKFYTGVAWFILVNPNSLALVLSKGFAEHGSVYISIAYNLPQLPIARSSINVSQKDWDSTASKKSYTVAWTGRWRC